jgi:hypothetical protein
MLIVEREHFYVPYRTPCCNATIRACLIKVNLEVLHHECGDVSSALLHVGQHAR